MNFVDLFSLALDLTAIVLTVFYLVRMTTPPVTNFFDGITEAGLGSFPKRSLHNQQIKRKIFV